MSDKKELNQEELEKVSGGLKRIGDVQIYELTEILSLGVETKVTILEGSYYGSSFVYVCDGTVTNQSVDIDTQQGSVVVIGKNTNRYEFYTDGKCKKNGSEINYWFGPQQNITQMI